MKDKSKNSIIHAPSRDSLPGSLQQQQVNLDIVAKEHHCFMVVVTITPSPGAGFSVCQVVSQHAPDKPGFPTWHEQAAAALWKEITERVTAVIERLFLEIEKGTGRTDAH